MIKDDTVITIEQSVERIVEDIMNICEFEATAPGNWSSGAYAAQQQRLKMRLRRSLIELLLVSAVIE